MPWVTKYNQYAATKMEAYQRLESNLTEKKGKISLALSNLKNSKRILENKVHYLGDLSGDFMYKYEGKRDDFSQHYLKIIGNIEKFIKDLDGAISQCVSKKQEWNNKIYTREWEEPEVDKYVRN